MGKTNLFGLVLVAVGMLNVAQAQDVLELETNAKKVDGKNLKCEITPVNGDDGVLSGLSYVCSHLNSSFWLAYEKLAKPDGALVYEESDREVIKLKLAQDFDPRSDGRITLDYLHSGISNTRHEYEMSAVRAGADWVIRDGDSGATVHKLCMKKNSKFLVGTVGISRVEPADSSGECDF